MKTKALSASDTSLDTASRQAMNQDFVALRDQITTIVKNAVFNGYNLVDGSTAQITALASDDGSRRITVSAQNMKLSGGIVTIKNTGTISTAAKASTMVSAIQTSLTNVDSALAKLSAGSKKFSVQLGFTQKLSDTLTGGIGNLVDADMAKEERDAPVAAGQAAARRPGAVHRQPGAAIPAVAVQVGSGGAAADAAPLIRLKLEANFAGRPAEFSG